MKVDKLTLALLVVVISELAFGQGTLRGTISDSTANEVPIGANIQVKGTALGASTDREGRYRKPGVPVGTHTVRVTYIGYRTREIVVVIEDGENSLNARLLADVVEGEEVVVTGQRRGQDAAINQQESRGWARWP